MLLSTWENPIYVNLESSYYACMPDRPKLPLPDDLENWKWSRDQIMNFTREEFAEWDHQTNGFGQFMPIFPNRKW